MTSDSNNLDSQTAIDLAHQPSFSLGDVRVHPPLRQLVRGSDGAEELVEPRVMQVLVALARAKGAIVTRDELVRDCWEGRFVSEDAINRALSRVRRLSEGIAAGAFRLETITKVGYRLRSSDCEPGQAEGGTGSAPPPERVSRRAVFLGGAAALLATGACATTRR